MARRWAEGSGVDLRFEVTGESVPLSPAIEVTLFRVAQEALTNVAKHARASRAGVTLSYAGDVVLLDIRDDGGGIHGENGLGFGLSSMRQRVRGVGGTLEVESAPGEGTAVSASVPALRTVRQ
jgi:signal transduction histidine kinase